MDIRSILEKVKRGEMDIDEAERKLQLLAIEEIEDVVRFDIGRELRRGIPEIILAEGKSTELLLKIVRQVVNRVGHVIVSRVQERHLEHLKRLREEGFEVIISELGRILSIRKPGYEIPKLMCRVGIVTGGTSDIYVAEEARFLLEEMGCETLFIADVGVAGIQRVIEAAKRLKQFMADVAIVVAGREGALPSALASLLDIPIIAVPTSLGYGIGGKGLAALLSMLQSCSLGISVVNIDNGVGAAISAYLICKVVDRARRCRDNENPSI